MSTPSLSPDSSSKGFPPWLLFVIAVLGPPAAFLPFAHVVTQNPVLIALFVLAYEVIVFILSFVGKVWQKLESPLVDHIAERITFLVQGRMASYRKHYCQYLIYEHQVFDVKGLSTRAAHDLELEQVFVELSIDPRPAHQASADLLNIPEDLRQGEHSSWDYLSSRSLANRHLVIIGAPGSGKTTLLKHTALTLARQKKNYRQEGRSLTLPLLLFLRDYTSMLQEKPDLSLVDAVQDHIQKKWHWSIPSSWIDHHLTQGKCLVLLDGLDEVADAASRRQMVAWVQQQMIAYGKNRFLLTSRPYGYRDNPLDGVTVLEVHSFTPKQVERFIQRWYLANELKSWGKEDPGVYLRAREGAEDLIQRLHRVPALLELAVNPLLLTMIARRCITTELAARKAGSSLCRDLRGLSGKASGGAWERTRVDRCSEAPGASAAGLCALATRSAGDRT